MNSLPCQGCRGMCCGPVPITEQELKQIRKKIKSMPSQKRSQLANQQRFMGTCIFYDQDHDKCGIHSARPAVCRAFGHYKNLTCFKNPEAATGDNWKAKEQPVGILSIDYSWAYFK